MVLDRARTGDVYPNNESRERAAMQAMDIGTAIKSGSFDVRPCNCGKCKGYDHLNLVSKTPLLLDVRDKEVRSFFSMTARYVKVLVTYHCNLVTRTVSASGEVRDPSGELVLRSEARPFSRVFVPTTEHGEEKLFGLLRIRGALFQAATCRRAA